MITKNLTTLFHRELEALKLELEAYANPSKLWMIDKGISNSGGNLALHLVGNLNHFIGFKLGNTGYIRQRDLEFSDKGIPVSEIISRIDDTKIMIETTLEQLKEEDLFKETKIHDSRPAMTIEFFLLHLLSHLSYHLGQINYHRRLLDTIKTEH